MSDLPSLRRTPVVGFGTPSDPGWSHLEILRSISKDLISKTGHKFPGAGGGDGDTAFGGRGESPFNPQFARN